MTSASQPIADTLVEPNRKSSTGDALANAATLSGYAGDPDFMMSLARGLLVLEAFSERKRALSVSEIARRTQLSRAAARRCLYTLECLGFVGQQDGQYALRPRVLHLGHAYFSSTSLVTVAQPVMDALSMRIDETCALAIMDVTDILYLVRSEVQRVLTFSLGMGSRLPAYCTSIGRMLLAHLSPEALDEYFRHADIRPRTALTKVTRAELEVAFAAARTNGYVVIEEELEPGLRAIAVPVRSGSGQVRAGISVSVRSAQVSEDDMVRHFLPEMHEAAREIGKLIAA